MNIILKVKPDVLTAKAGELSTERIKILNIMDEVKSEISSLNGVWISDASTEYQNRFKQIYDDIENVLTIVAEYTSDLNEAATIYETAEKSAKSAAEGLPTDGVFKV